MCLPSLEYIIHHYIIALTLKKLAEINVMAVLAAMVQFLIQMEEAVLLYTMTHMAIISYFAGNTREELALLDSPVCILNEDCEKFYERQAYVLTRCDEQL
jgi:hypothetical protein